jgi:hypothetical protein
VVVSSKASLNLNWSAPQNWDKFFGDKISKGERISQKEKPVAKRAVSPELKLAAVRRVQASRR